MKLILCVELSVYIDVRYFLSHHWYLMKKGLSLRSSIHSDCMTNHVGCIYVRKFKLILKGSHSFCSKEFESEEYYKHGIGIRGII